MAYLDITFVDGSKKRIPLEKDSTVIGRDSKADIVIEHASLSRQHARISQKENRHWIEDLGSVNGILLNGKPIGSAKLLSSQTLIQLGEIRIQYISEEAEKQLTFALIGKTKPYVGKEFVLLPQGELSVGRERSSAVVLQHVSLSRKHALLTVTPKNVRVKDLKSSNGTFVNNVKVSEKLLEPSDVVRFGSLEFELTIKGKSFRAFKSDKAIRFGAYLGLAVVLALSVAVIFIVPKTRHFILVKFGFEQSDVALYQKVIENSLHQADTYHLQQNWPLALTAYQQVLVRDPLNERAKKGVESAQLNIQEQKKFIEANNFLKSNKLYEALIVLRKMSANSFYSTQAQGLLNQQKPIYLSQTLTEIKKACNVENYSECLNLAKLYLTLEPQHTVVNAYLWRAELGLNSPKEPIRLMLKKYPNEDMREIAVLYSVGELNLAQKKAAEFKSILALLNNVEELARLDTLIASQRLLITDAMLLPESYPSVMRDQALEHIANDFLKQGQGAFNRGQYRKAFTFWQQGLEYSPSHTMLLKAIKNLKERSIALLQHLGPLSKETCQMLQDILFIHRDDQDIQKTAQDLSQGCKTLR